MSVCVSRTYTYSGFCQKPPPPTLRPSESGSAMFHKTPFSVCGSVGVLTYDLQNESTQQYDGKLAVMFSVPFDYMSYRNWFGVGIFDMNTKCDYSLFDEMYNKPETTFVRHQANFKLIYKGKAVTIRATMSDSSKAVIKVEVSGN
uniref:DELTA-sagatoxin-Srs1a-like n=1 Tax=Dicentrarchus labrax TaxID=13489 RepID=A0A8P4GKI9_DICLA